MLRASMVTVLFFTLKSITLGPPSLIGWLARFSTISLSVFWKFCNFEGFARTFAAIFTVVKDLQGIICDSEEIFGEVKTRRVMNGLVASSRSRAAASSKSSHVFEIVFRSEKSHRLLLQI